MVSVRHAVLAAEQAGVVSGVDAAGIVAACRGLAYTSRSWRAIEAAFAGDAAPVGRVREFLAEYPEHADVKAADAIDTLSRLPELAEIGSTRRPDSPDWVDSPMWRNRLLHEWQADFSGFSPDRDGVSDGAVMRFQQIYHSDFPRRWRAFALRGIVDADEWEPECDIDTAARATAARYGIDHQRLTDAQRAEWLTPREISELSLESAVGAILVRGYRAPYGIFDLVCAEPELVADPAARKAVAESEVVNAEIAEWAPGQGIEYLKPDVLQEHLGTMWGAADEPSLVAAARDRGFGSLTEAVEAVRPFFLRHHLTAELET
jgi:hypothetical protein